MDPKFGMYLAYLAITAALTFWVARTLYRNGKVFLRDALASDELAESVNKLLVVGFYLLNLGYATYAMKSADQITDPTNALETLSKKIGLVMLALGTIHFINIFVLSRFRRRAQHQNLAAMVPPHLPPGRPLPPQRQPQYAQYAGQGQQPQPVQQPAPANPPVRPATAAQHDAPAPSPADDPNWQQPR
ncbi:hypothetical protein F4553_004044 [Allocatelliglobosispora scoriae]|uniref:Uncharacterized protein n=1 Tax=Allocatelliglobosispora scoriae TaxID=643052 RepID=A0A841BSI3_9ACTN|nr:hypothetical protein [Allocatelliglobosispora scoriae]MBB5870665.1 hypothetical protein [Allocatelliglobosispora scoriae]